MTTLALDHIFVFVSPGAPEAAALDGLGLTASFRRQHPGQGTENLCYCFDNAYLELLWVADPVAVRAPALARTGLAARGDWRRSGASPFGIALRGADPAEPADRAAPLPFPCWDYAPPFLPAGMTIAVAVDSDDPRQPFLFRSPGHHRPDAWTDGRAGMRQRPAGLTEIAGVALLCPPGLAPAPAFRQLATAGLIALGRTRGGPRLILTLARGNDGPPRRLGLPDFGWV